MKIKFADYPDGIGYGSAVFGLIIGVWSYCLSQNRLIPILQILLSLYIVSLAVAPFPLGFNFQMSSHAMVYNRYGYALLALIMVDVFPMNGGRQQGRTEFIGGVSSGAVVAITLFLKANYFAGAVILIGSSILLKGFYRSHFTGLIVGFLTAALVLLYFIQFDIVSMIDDLKMAAGSRINGVFYDILLLKFKNNILVFLLVILMGVQICNREVSKTERLNYCVLYFGMAVLFVDTLILFSNQQFFTLPISIVFSLLLVNRTIIQNQRQESIKSDSTSLFQWGGVFLGGVFFLVFFVVEIAGLGYGVLQKSQFSKLYAEIKFKEPRLTSLKLFDYKSDSRSNGSLYIKYVNDGIHLLRKNSESSETVLTMDNFNPFPYSMGRKPAKGGVAAADTLQPSEKNFSFGTADLVMVPKQSALSSDNYDSLYKIYKPALMHHFRLVAESDIWFLYRRK